MLKFCSGSGLCGDYIEERRRCGERFDWWKGVSRGSMTWQGEIFVDFKCFGSAGAEISLDGLLTFDFVTSSFCLGRDSLRISLTKATQSINSDL